MFEKISRVIKSFVQLVTFDRKFPLLFAVVLTAGLMTGCSVAAAIWPPRTEPSEMRNVAVENVQVEVGVGSPIPVDIFVSGSWPDLCSQLSEISQQLEGSTIEVSIQTTAQDPECPPDYLGLPFRIAIPLNAVELPIGRYLIEVNGETTIFDWSGTGG